MLVEKVTTRLARGRNLIAGGLRTFGCTSNGNGDRESRRARFYVGKAETQGHSNSRLHGVHVFQCTVSVKKEKRRFCSFAFSKCCEVFCSKHGVFFFWWFRNRTNWPCRFCSYPFWIHFFASILVFFLHCLLQFAVMFSYCLIRNLSRSHLHLVSLPSFFSSFLVGVFHLLFSFPFSFALGIPLSSILLPCMFCWASQRYGCDFSCYCKSCDRNSGCFLLLFDIDLHPLLGADEGSGNVILYNICVVGIWACVWLLLLLFKLLLSFWVRHLYSI